MKLDIRTENYKMERAYRMQENLCPYSSGGEILQNAKKNPIISIQNNPIIKWENVMNRHFSNTEM